MEKIEYIYFKDLAVHRGVSFADMSINWTTINQQERRHEQ